MKIPWQQINEETLNSLLEEFVSREGTDYGQTMYSLEQKVNHVRRQLEKGSIVIVFDHETETCNIVDAETVGKGQTGNGNTDWEDNE